MVFGWLFGMPSGPGLQPTPSFFSAYSMSSAFKRMKLSTKSFGTLVSQSSLKGHNVSTICIAPFGSLIPGIGLFPPGFFKAILYGFPHESESISLPSSVQHFILLYFIAFLNALYDVLNSKARISLVGLRVVVVRRDILPLAHESQYSSNKRNICCCIFVLYALIHCRL